MTEYKGILVAVLSFCLLLVFSYFGYGFYLKSTLKSRIDFLLEARYPTVSKIVLRGTSTITLEAQMQIDAFLGSLEKERSYEVSKLDSYSVEIYSERFGIIEGSLYYMPEKGTGDLLISNRDVDDAYLGFKISEGDKNAIFKERE